MQQALNNKPQHRLTMSTLQVVLLLLLMTSAATAEPNEDDDELHSGVFGSMKKKKEVGQREPDSASPLVADPPHKTVDLEEFLALEVQRRGGELSSFTPPLTPGQDTADGSSLVVPVVGRDDVAAARSSPAAISHHKREEYFQAGESALKTGLTKPSPTSLPTPTETHTSRLVANAGKGAEVSAAIRNLQAAARRGHPLAMNRLAVLHAHGLGIAKSEAKAVLFHKFASFGGSVESSIALSHRHEHGIGVQPSIKAASVYAFMASKLVSLSYNVDLKAEQHQVRLADEIKGLVASSLPSQKLVSGKRYVNTRGHLLSADDVLQMFQMEADRGSPSALMFLGYAYLHGDYGVRRDVHRAVRLFTDALQEHSHAAAYGALGQIYVQGVLTADPPILPDPQLALKYFSDGAKLEDQASYNGLGYFYAKAAAASAARDALTFGLEDANRPTTNSPPTTKALYEKAAKMFLEATKRNNADAAYNLAILTKYGLGVSQDTAHTLALLRRASSGGSILAKHQLGVHHGRFGQDGFVSPSYSHALSEFKDVLSKGPWNRRLMQAYDSYHSGDYQTALLQYLMSAEIGDKLGSSNSLFMLQRPSARASGQYGLGTENIQLMRFEYSAAPRGTPAGPPPQIVDKALAAENLVVGLTLRLARDGDKDAQLFLGDYYYYTSTPDRSLMKKSLEHYRMAAEGDDGLAQANFNVGYMCQRGLGTPTDYHLSKRYYDRALHLSTSDTAGDAYYAVNAALMTLNFQYWFDYFFDLAKREDVSQDVGPSLTRRAPLLPVESPTTFLTSLADLRIWLVRMGRLAPKVFGFPLDDVALICSLVTIGGLLALRNHVALN